MSDSKTRVKQIMAAEWFVDYRSGVATISAKTDPMPCILGRITYRINGEEPEQIAQAIVRQHNAGRGK